MTAVAVFDTQASRLHVDDDLSYAYTPQTLTYYKTVRDAVEAARQTLASEADSKVVSPASFAGRFTPGTSVHALISTLSGKTDLQHLRTLSSVNETEQQQHDSREATLAALRTTNPGAELRVAEMQSATLGSAQSALEAVVGFNVAEYARRKNELLDAQSAERDATVNSFEATGIPGVLGSEWKTFIEAAYAYEQSVKGGDIAQTCAYCRQELGEAAITLLSKYRDYCSGDARKRREEAQTRLIQSTSSLLAAPFDNVTDAVRSEIGSDSKHTWVPLAAALASSKQFQTDVRNGAETNTLPEEVPMALAWTRTELDRLKELAASLRIATTERTASLASAEKETAALKDRLSLRTFIDAIEAAIGQMRWVDAVQGGLAGLTQSLKQLTEASTAHTSQLVNASFEERFQRECQALEAPSGVSLEFPGREAQAKRKKVIASDVRPSDVLSEGEQKALAMADFIAESCMSGGIGPLVFDDPVNSLDYRRLEIVARTIQRLARERQVVVFTHNVWFASVLLDLESDLRKRTKYWDVARTSSEAGIVTPASHPQIDSYKNLRGRFNVVLAQAKKQVGDELYEAIKKGYGLLRSMTEVVAETDLFKGVSQRYQAHVMMTRLPEIEVSSLQDAINRLYPIYERACRCLDGHSQPIEQSNLQLSLDTMESDFKVVEDVHASNSDS